MKFWQYAVIIAVFQATTVPAMAAPAKAPPAAPASPVELAGDVKLVKVRDANGRKVQELVEPKVVVPGDILVFSTRYRNGGPLPVTQFVVTNPLPAAVMLAPEGAEKHVVSVDGGKTWGALAGFQVDDGKGGKRPATATDVTHVRWTLALIQPGATGVVTFNAIVR
jgi:uncharacterized repeat protein (TIGR01451 family)